MSKSVRMFALAWNRGRGRPALISDQAGDIRWSVGRSWDVDPKVGWRKAYKRGARVVPVLVMKP